MELRQERILIGVTLVHTTPMVTTNILKCTNTKKRKKEEN